MMGVLKRYLPLAFVVVASIWLVSTAENTADWAVDAGPPVEAMAHGHLHEYFHTKAMMGPFAMAVQAPFTALAPGGELGRYQWASFPCLLALGFLGLYLAGIARRRGVSSTGQVLIAVFCLVNPLTLEALENGHPEEMLTAALAIGAVATASEGRNRYATILLGLAVASKQWAVIAILPTMMALPTGRLRTVSGAAAIATAFMLPGFLVAPDSFIGVQSHVASAGRVATPWSVWYPFALVVTEEFNFGSTHLVAHVHESPVSAGSLSHSLIALLALGIPLALAWRRGRFSLTGDEAMALLALLALVRCILDPADNLYYHAPLLIALFGWDAFDCRALPLRGLTGTAIALELWWWSHHLADVSSFNALYLATMLTACLAISAFLVRRGGHTDDARLVGAPLVSH